MNIGSGFLKVAISAALLGGFATAAAASGQHVSPLVSSATLVGHHDARAQLGISMALKLRNPEQLSAFLRDLDDRSSPNYHKYLTQAQFTRLYGPTPTQVSEVKQFLRANGITVDGTSKGRTRVYAHGSVAALEKAFAVKVNDYTANGQAFYAPNVSPKMPASLASTLWTVKGLDNALVWKSHMIEPAAAPKPRSSVGFGPQGYSPQQIATAYGWPSLTDKNQAKGVNLAIITAYTYRASDVKAFWAQYGLPTHTLTNIPVSFPSVSTPEPQRINGETTLDVEHSSSMSPGSNIYVYEALNASNTFFDTAYVQVADDDIADVVSTSWGLSESSLESFDYASLVTEHEAVAQMSAQGMAMFAAAGDDGSADRTSGVNNADYPAADPFVTAAGGTSLVLNDDGTIASETVWGGIPGDGATGGADSIIFAQPNFQSGFASNSACDGDHTAEPGPGGSGDVGADVGCTGAGAASRVESDLSMDADPIESYSFYFNGRWSRAGGTSFVAPQLAGLAAITTHSLRVARGDTTSRIGNFNVPLYILGVNATDNAQAFNDITVGSNGNFSAGTGWDYPTGWGTPKGATFIIGATVSILITP